MNFDIASLGATPTERLLTMMALLRDPDTGCPWDIEQDFTTIAPYTIEEAYEVADAIARGDMMDLKEELGDLLLQVAFHSQMAREDGHFDFDAVADGLVEKMVRRHPHVFGDAHMRDRETQTLAWETQKAEERQSKTKTTPTSALDGVALNLPELMRAEKLQKRAARVGFDWPDTEPVYEKITEELDEVRQAVSEGQSADRVSEEIGDVLFSVVNLARKLGVDPEVALRSTNRKFTDRFHYIEDKAGEDINTLDLDTLEALWIEAKVKLSD